MNGLPVSERAFLPVNEDGDLHVDSPAWPGRLCVVWRTPGLEGLTGMMTSTYRAAGMIAGPAYFGTWQMTAARWLWADAVRDFCALRLSAFVLWGTYTAGPVHVSRVVKHARRAGWLAVDHTAVPDGAILEASNYIRARFIEHARTLAVNPMRLIPQE